MKDSHWVWSILLLFLLASRHAGPPPESWPSHAPSALTSEPEQGAYNKLCPLAHLKSVAPPSPLVTFPASITSTDVLRLARDSIAFGRHWAEQDLQVGPQTFMPTHLRQFWEDTSDAEIATSLAHRLTPDGASLLRHAVEDGLPENGLIPRTWTASMDSIDPASVSYGVYAVIYEGTIYIGLSTASGGYSIQGARAPGVREAWVEMMEEHGLDAPLGVLPATAGRTYRQHFWPAYRRDHPSLHYRTTANLTPVRAVLLYRAVAPDTGEKIEFDEQHLTEIAEYLFIHNLRAYDNPDFDGHFRAWWESARSGLALPTPRRSALRVNRQMGMSTVRYSQDSLNYILGTALRTTTHDMSRSTLFFNPSTHLNPNIVLPFLTAFSHEYSSLDHSTWQMQVTFAPTALEDLAARLGVDASNFHPVLPAEPGSPDWVVVTAELVIEETGADGVPREQRIGTTIHHETNRDHVTNGQRRLHVFQHWRRHLMEYFGPVAVAYTHGVASEDHELVRDLLEEAQAGGQSGDTE